MSRNLDLPSSVLYSSKLLLYYLSMIVDPFQLLPLYGITDNYIENLTKNPAGFGTSHLGEEPDGATSDGQQLSDPLFPQGDRHRLGPVFGFQLL